MTTSYPPLPVVFADDALVGVLKPAGLPTANAQPGQESVYTLLQRTWPAGAFIGIVSRLDAPVSGIVVVAKTPAAAADLAEQFRARTVEKTYLAVVEGRFPAPLETWVDWHDAIGRLPNRPRSTIARSPADGPAQPAHTVARVLRRAGEVSLVELKPLTGRRHQLRVQLASRGCPIVGDRLYGARLPFAAGIALHAAELTVAHPTTAAALRLSAPLPEAWRPRFASLLPPPLRP